MYYWYLFIYSIQIDRLYYIIDRDKQEKEEAEPHGEVELVLQLSWLERYTDNVEVGSSTLPGTTNGIKFGGLAQLARASALHAEGQRFESVILHSASDCRLSKDD